MINHNRGEHTMQFILQYSMIISSVFGCGASWLPPLHAWLIDEPKPIVAEGASFSEPAGWVRLTPEKAKTKGLFIPADADRKAPESLIMVVRLYPDLDAI